MSTRAKTTTKQHNDTFQGLGTFLAADIVGHRDLPESLAVDSVRVLKTLAAKAAEDGCLYAQLADRLVICRPGLDSVSFVKLARRLAEQLLDVKGDSTQPARQCGARIALHCGLFQSVDGIPFGPGPTDCARLTGFASESIIVCTSQFAGVWADQKGPEIYDAELWPKIPEVPPEQRRLIWRPEGFQIGLGGLPDLYIFLMMARPDQLPLDVPQRIIELNDIENRLFDLCDTIGSVALDWIGDPAEPPACWKRVRARLFVRVDEIQPRRPQLVGTKFESGVAKSERFHSTAGTQYEFGRRKEGFLGRALATGKIQVTAPLPDPDREEQAYVAALAGPPWRIVPEKVKAFQRKARRYLGIPLPRTFRDQDLVLCLDFGANPVPNVSEESFVELGDLIGEKFGHEIVALFRLRTG